ncbi:hypothetical protein PIB30_086466 [Stylosanthes scabra]|uniref:Uncharacterized protein n=1 Tax=Stylosanthes scabra TaxID=79078 RepID=A0ABU6ZRT1_9FABA|nr:hypothetical protein [Stylosanthes scabra]
MMPEGSNEGSIPFSNQPVADVVDSHDESVKDEDGDEEEEDEDEEEVQGVNYFPQTLPVYAQPAISRPYDHPASFKVVLMMIQSKSLRLAKNLRTKKLLYWP